VRTGGDLGAAACTETRAPASTAGVNEDVALELEVAAALTGRRIHVTLAGQECAER
jgi:hypothetical protein